MAVRATLPLDDLDGSFTGEELRLLESWLEEHRGECEPVLGGGKSCQRLQDRAARRQFYTHYKQDSLKLTRTAVTLRRCGCCTTHPYPSALAAPAVAFLLPSAEEPVAVKPTSSHHLLPSSAVFSSTAPSGPSPHASAIESPGTPAHAGAWRATPSCWPSPFLEDSQTARASSSRSSPNKAGTDRRATPARAATSQADEQWGSVLDWLSGWARLAEQTDMQANASEPGFSADLPALQYRQRSWAGCDVRASMQQRCMSMAPPGPDIRTSPERKRSRSCMVVPLPSVAALLPSYIGQPSKRSHW